MTDNITDKLDDTNEHMQLMNDRKYVFQITNAANLDIGFINTIELTIEYFESK